MCDDEIFAPLFRLPDRREGQIEGEQRARDLPFGVEQNAAVVVSAVRLYIVVADFFGIERVDTLIYFAQGHGIPP